MKKFGIPLLLLAALLPVSAQERDSQSAAAALMQLPPPAPNDTVVEEIVARVNNAIITRADLQRSREQIAQEVQQANVPDQQKVIADREKDQLKDLINQQLLIQKGQDLGYTADTDLVKRLDEIRKQVGAKDMEELQATAEKQGVSWEDFKNNLRNQLISQHVIQSEVGSHIQITPAEVKQFYDAHKADMEQPEQVRLSEILVPVNLPKGADGKEDTSPEAEQKAVAEAQAKVQDLEAQIKSGKTFEDVAKANSSGPTASNGGDLGYFKRGALAKELEDKTFAMKGGEVTDPIRTKQGFIILKVTEHTQAGVPDMKKVEGAIQERIYYTKLEPALNDYFKKLREDAYIDVKSGYSDTGAVSTQTKPVFTEEKKKETKAQKEKKKKHFIFF
ncbi:MAG TPA: peptidylprolyl isomerase [Terriglobales bacterium]